MKQGATQHDDWLLVDQDECWFSRFAQPAFAETDKNLRLVERTPVTNEPDKAIACFGAISQLTQERWLYFADGQPNSASTILFLQALLTVALEKKNEFWSSFGIGLPGTKANSSNNGFAITIVKSVKTGVSDY